MRMKNLKESLRNKLSVDYSKLFLPVVVLWFSIRVVPKPSRVTYPCQRAAVGLIALKLGIALSTLVVSTTSLFNRRSVKTLSVLVLVGVTVWDPLTLVYYQYSFAASDQSLFTVSDITYNFPSNRIVRVHSDTATGWDFDSSVSQYWEHINQTAVDLMVEKGVMELTGTANPVDAWTAILSGYTSGQKVGIKINGNDWWNTNDREIDSIPQITNAIIKGLKSIGVPESDIRIIENTHQTNNPRVIRPYYTSIVTALYPNVVFQYATATNPTYGSVAGTEVNFPYTTTRRINDQIASVDHLILVPIMKAITPNWGITGSIKLMQGVIQDVSAFHQWLTRITADNPDVLIYQNPHIIGKTRLILGDGLFGTWTGQHFAGGGYGGIDYLNTPVNDIPKPWITSNNGAPDLLFFGVDPVAIDSVMYDHILRERNAQEQVAGQTLAPFNEPQLLAGEAANLGIREHGPPYSNIGYTEVELGTSPTPTHDVAVTNVVSSPTSVKKGELVNVDVTVANQGNTDELFDVTAFYNQSIVETRSGISLVAGNTQVLTFIWNTSGVSEGAYSIKAETSPVSGETDLSDNVYVDGTVLVNPIYAHDVAVTNVSASPTTALPGQTINVTVVAKNDGTNSETFTLSVYANTTLIDSRSVTLNPDGTTTEVFSWNTTGALGVYIIKAEANVVLGEIDTADNTREFDGAVAVFPYPVEFPVAAFTYFPTTPLSGENITFNGTSSSDPDGTIVSYTWNFGDGTSGNGAITYHVYSTNGNHTISLTVTDNDGLFDTEKKSLVIVKQPEASFNFTPGAPQVDQVITFNATTSTPEGGIITSYAWDFGDGARLTESNPVITHRFLAKGTYTVTLIVTDSEGLSDTAVVQVKVEEKLTQPWLSSEYLLALFIAGMVAAAVAVTAMLYFRRKS